MPEEATKKHFLRQFPANIPQWGKCRFVLDKSNEEYDWLVVYHDLFRQPPSSRIEELQCPQEKTILITTEPSTITVYGSDYLRQFGTVMTSQEPWAIPHHNPVFTQPGLMWYYGYNFDTDEIRSFDELQVALPPPKTRILSTVCSDRKGKLTLHSKRYAFTDRLMARLPQLDRFGTGINPIADKAEALDPYKYHLTIENHVFQHHLTEKLPDAFLGFTLPFYHGSPNASEYFPAESFIPVDINNFDQTVDIIRSTIANNEYEDRLPYIIESRRRVLEEHNLFAVLDREITRQDQLLKKSNGNNGKGIIMNRQTIRIKRPLTGIRSIFEKILVKSKHVR